MENKSVLIIGGGAIGLFSAFYLIRQGHAVTIIDKGNIPGNQSCSAGNAGLIVPSHFVPIASRGVLKEGLRNLIRPSAPFGLNWSLNPELFGWLWQFYKSSISRSVAAKTEFLAELGMHSRNLYREIQEQENVDLTLSLTGLVMLSRKQKTLEKDILTAKKSEKLGIPAEVWSAEKYRSLNPDLNSSVAGAVYYPLDGMVDPMPMLLHMKEWLVHNGAVFLEHSSVKSWNTGKSSVRSLTLDGQEVSAANYLICAGDQSGQMMRGIGLSVPLQPAKGFSYVFKNSHGTISHPTLLQDSHVALTPYAAHTRIAGNFLLGNSQPTIPQNRLSAIYNSVKETYPGWVIPMPDSDRAWTGYRPVSPDGLPIIGRSSVYHNLSVATGHAMMGISLAPVSGLLISRWIDGINDWPSYKPFLSPVRFGNKF